MNKQLTIDVVLEDLIDDTSTSINEWFKRKDVEQLLTEYYQELESFYHQQ